MLKPLRLILIVCLVFLLLLCLYKKHVACHVLLILFKSKTYDFIWFFKLYLRDDYPWSVTSSHAKCYLWCRIGNSFVCYSLEALVHAGLRGAPAHCRQTSFSDSAGALGALAFQELMRCMPYFGVGVCPSMNLSEVQLRRCAIPGALVTPNLKRPNHAWMECWGNNVTCTVRHMQIKLEAFEFTREGAAYKIMLDAFDCGFTAEYVELQ